MSIQEKIESSGGVISNPFTDEALSSGEISTRIQFGAWHFNVWIDDKSNSFNASIYNKKYIGVLPKMSIGKGIDEMIKIASTGRVSDITCTHSEGGYRLLSINQLK